MLGGMLAALVAVLLALQVRETRQLLHAIDGGRDAISLSAALIDVVVQTQRHRDLAGSVLGGLDDADIHRLAAQGAVDEAMGQFDGLLARQVTDARARADWQDIGAEWQGLTTAIGRRLIGAAASRDRHAALIEAELELHDRLLDRVGTAAASADDVVAAQTHRAWLRVVEDLHRADAGSAALPLLQNRLQALARAQAEAAARQAAARRESVVRAQWLQAGGLLLGLWLALGVLAQVRTARPGAAVAAVQAEQESRRERQRVLQRLTSRSKARPTSADDQGREQGLPEGERSEP
jgi:hypothetical protein